MLSSFLLTIRELLRGKVFQFLLLGEVFAFVFLPQFIRTDGSEFGFLEMYVRVVSGGVYVLIIVAMLVLSAGLFSAERAAKRLSLTVVRPTCLFLGTLGRYLGLLVMAAILLSLQSVALYFSLPSHPPCQHHAAPNLPAPSICAKCVLEDFLKDPQTPAAVRKAPRAAVLSLLTAKEKERYDTIRPGETFAWPFSNAALKKANAIKVRFATAYEMRAPFTGLFTTPFSETIVSNTTQSILTLPLSPACPSLACPSLACPVVTPYRAAQIVNHKSQLVNSNPQSQSQNSQISNAIINHKSQIINPQSQIINSSSLSFKNTGEVAVMLRPRRDLEILSPGDAWAWNLTRATLEMLSVCALVAALGIFLSAALSRPVALFVAFALMAIILMAPSVILEYPDELEAPLGDRVGLFIARQFSTLLAGVTSTAPLSALATQTAIEHEELLKTCAVNFILLPSIFLGAAALLLARKPI